MGVNGLDHVNILTNNLTASISFYGQLLGLTPRLAPTQVSPDAGRWLYDENDHPIVHLVHRHEAPSFDATGALHHVALSCSGKAALISRAQQLGIEYRVNRIESHNITQVFVRDPHGVLLELNFKGE